MKWRNNEVKSKPAGWIVVSASLLLVGLLAGGLRGVGVLQGMIDPMPAARAALPRIPQTPDGLVNPTPVKIADKATTAALQKVVGGQIAALQKRNYPKALSFAAPGFQRQWKPDSFGQMITTSYPELGNAKSVSFGQANFAPGGATAFVPVLVTNAQKQETGFVYVLTRDTAPANRNKNENVSKAVWHVAGCERQTPTPQRAVPHSLNEA